MTITLPPETMRELARLVSELMLPPPANEGVPLDGYLNSEAAAQYLGVNRRRMYDLVSRGALEPVGRDGRRLLFTRAALDNYVTGR